MVQTATLDTGQVPQEHQQVTFEKERTGEISGLDGYLPFYQDLEAVHSISDLIRSIYAVIQNAPGASAKFRSRIAKWSSLLPSRISGVELATSKQTWQVLLSTAFDDLFKIARDQVILLLWDEFPLMLYNIQRRGGKRLRHPTLGSPAHSALDTCPALALLIHRFRGTASGAPVPAPSGKHERSGK